MMIKMVKKAKVIVHEWQQRLVLSLLDFGSAQRLSPKTKKLQN